MSESSQPQDTVGPISHKQELYVQSDVDVTIFGGAMGSGKSEIGIIDILKHLDTKDYIGVIVRRTTPQLKGPGGMFTKCKRYFDRVYGPENYRWREKDGKFVFPHSNAEVYLKHFENEQAHINYQGLEANQFLVDEGTQFSQEMIQVLMSRMRNPNCPSVKPHMKITCNPDADHFLKKFVEWYLQEDGRPDVTKDGIKRYFAFSNGEFVFADTKFELMQQHSIEESDCLSYTFISANVYDNPVVMEVNPGYVAWLKGLKGVERERNLYGNWNTRETKASFWNRDWCEVVDLPPVRPVKRIRAWDISGTLPSDTNRDPDYTVGVLMSKTRDPFYYVEDVVRGRWQHGGVLEMILQTAKHDGKDTLIVIPRDPGAAGKAYAASIQRSLAEAGYYCRTKIVSGSKVNRFASFASMSEAGGVRIVRGPWNSAYMLELELFDGGRKGHDDQVDASADAFTTLAQDVTIPAFTVPDMTQTNPFNLRNF